MENNKYKTMLYIGIFFIAFGLVFLISYFIDIADYVKAENRKVEVVTDFSVSSKYVGDNGHQVTITAVLKNTGEVNLEDLVIDVTIKELFSKEIEIMRITPVTIKKGEKHIINYAVNKDTKYYAQIEDYTIMTSDNKPVWIETEDDDFDPVISLISALALTGVGVVLLVGYIVNKKREKEASNLNDKSTYFITCKYCGSDNHVANEKCDCCNAKLNKNKKQPN